MRTALTAGALLCLTTSTCASPPLGDTPRAGSFAEPIAPAQPEARPGSAHAVHARPHRMPRPISTPAATALPIAQPNLPLAWLDGILPDPLHGYGLVLEDLATGARAAVNESAVFPSASLYKLGLAWLVMREVDAGTLRLDGPLAIEAEDAIEAEPAGGIAEGDTPTARVALESMLSLSSNNAAHAFLRVLGRGAFDQEMDRIGLTQTRVPE